ncbi:MAG TPA: hypothetical protein VFN49_04370 [Candidatus Aquilonibacter sp.]|nr:hypothetical protein [Candidatus Aquilonibacter sp.]
MRAHVSRSAAALAVTLLLAACGGHGNATLPSTPAAPHGAQSQAVSFKITIPKKIHNAKRAQWISPSVQSLVVAYDDPINGAIPYQPIDLTPTSSGCSATTNGTQCTVQLSLPVGHDTYTVSLYDQTLGQGQIVGKTYGITDVVGGQTNTIDLVIGGVATAYSFGLSGSLTEGAPGSVSVIVTATDADGNNIVGNIYECATPTVCNDPQFELSDAYGEYTLEQNGQKLAKDPNSHYYVLGTDSDYATMTNGVTLNYNGGPPETLTLKVHTVNTYNYSSDTVTNTLTQTTTKPTNAPSYIAVAEGAFLQAYSGSVGDSQPYSPNAGIFTIGSFISTGSNACAPASAPIAVDNSGNLVSLQMTCADNTNTAAYAAFDLTSTTPVWSVTGVPSGSQGTGPNLGMGFDANGYMYVAAFLGSYSPDGGATTYPQSTCVGVWKPGINGAYNASTMIDHTIGCNNGYRINEPIGGFAVAKNGTVYVDTAYNQTSEGILIYAAGTTDPSQYTALTSTTNGSLSSIATAKGLAVDSGGKLYAANWGNNSIAIFAAGASGAATPIATIAGANTLLCGPHAVAVDAYGTIYVENSGSASNPSNACTNSVSSAGSITVYPSGSNGNVAPARVYALSSNLDDTYNGIALIP